MTALLYFAFCVVAVAAMWMLNMRYEARKRAEEDALLDREGVKVPGL